MAQSPLYMWLPFHGSGALFWSLYIHLYASCGHLPCGQICGYVLCNPHSHVKSHHLHSEKHRGEKCCEEFVEEESNLGCSQCHESDDLYTTQPVVVRFKLTEFGVLGLTDDEKIESGDKSNGFVICGKYHNRFIAVQRILSFGAKCTIIEPEDFKEHIIQVLKKMKEVYNG
jgi:hypothetical protein